MTEAQTRDFTFRRPTEADHARIVRQVDDWWGGRRLHDLLPRLWFQHFTGTSWIVEDGDTPDGSARLHVFLANAPGIDPLAQPMRISFLLTNSSAP